MASPEQEDGAAPLRFDVRAEREITMLTGRRV